MEFRFRYNGADHVIRLEPQPDGSYVAHLGGSAYQVEVKRAHHGQFNLLIDGRRVHAYTADCETRQTGAHLRYVALVDRRARLYEFEKVKAVARRSARAGGGGGLAAQMPGQVLDVLVAEGQTVEQGQTLLILEAMKMEMRVTAPHAGVVARLLVRAGNTVERGQQLIEIHSED